MKKADALITQNLKDLARLSEIARQALRNLIANNRPAIPAYYEKAFFDVAIKAGEMDLIDQASSTLPVGKKVTIMVEGVASLISDLDSDINQYRSGIDKHGGQINKQSDLIKKLSS
jgi:hypothetical protein